MCPNIPEGKLETFETTRTGEWDTPLHDTAHRPASFHLRARSFTSQVPRLQIDRIGLFWKSWEQVFFLKEPQYLESFYGFCEKWDF